jgi:hydrogenase expression/formation protein HypD
MSPGPCDPASRAGSSPSTVDPMRFADEYRDRGRAEVLAAQLAAAVEPGRPVRIMEVCGGHTHAIHRHGLGTHLPPEVEFVHGPGCPVCVLPRGRLDDAVALARDEPVTLCTYGDLLRVPGTHGSLGEAGRAGADVRIVYSPLDAVAHAAEHPERQVVFLGIGFETTAPATAAAIRQADALGLANFSVLCNLVRVVPPLVALLDDPSTQLDGLIGPGHVSTIIGCQPYLELVERFGLPVVVAGFEPLDLLAATVEVVRLAVAGHAEVRNGYPRAVTWEGNPVALALLDEVFEVRPEFEWRGLGWIERSGYAVAERYAAFDAERRFVLPGVDAPDPRACRCGDVLRGAIRPDACKVFGTACTPERPIGACMVSSEGACAAAYRYGPEAGRASVALEARR